MANREVPFQDGMRLGRGYDRLTGEVRPTNAVTFPSSSGPPGAGGQQVTADCVIISDVASLHKQLGISVDAGGSYMGFSADAKVNYANTCDFSSFSTYAVVRVSVQNAFESVDAPEFSQDAKDLIVNKDGADARFRERFGDAFIAGQRTGGEFFAIYQITSTEQSERESLAVNVQAAFDGIIASAHLNTAITTATASSHSHLEVHVHLFRQGTVSEANFQIDDILAESKKFPVAVSGDKAFPYVAMLQDYKALKSPIDDFNYIDIQNQQDVLEDLARKRFEFLSLRDDLSYILRHPESFQNRDGTPVDTAALDAQRVKVVDTINTMERAAAACARDAKKCEFPTFDVGSFTKPIPKPPVLAPVTIPAGPAWRVTPVNTGGATFPLGGQLSPNGFAVDGQGRLTTLPAATGLLSVIPGINCRPGGFVAKLTDIGKLAAFTAVMTVDVTGAFCLVWTRRDQNPPQWRVAPIGGTIFSPGGYITQPWPGVPGTNVCMAIDAQGTMTAIFLPDGDGVQGPTAQLLPASGASFPPGAHVTMPIEDSAGMTSTWLSVDVRGRLTTISAPNTAPSTPVLSTLDGPLFPPGGYLNQPGGSRTQIALVVDQQGRLTAIWRPLGQLAWKLTAISGAGTFVPGGWVSDLRDFGYRKPGATQPTLSPARVAFAIDIQGRLTTISLRDKDTPEQAVLAPIGTTLFPPGGKTLNAVSGLTHDHPDAAGFTVDQQGQLQTYTYQHATDSWNTAPISTIPFPADCPFGRVGNDYLAIDANGAVNMIHYG